MKVMVVFGTRPEAIKMAPLVKALQAAPGLQTVVCVTAQHRQMLDQVLRLFEITPEHDLDVMKPGQDLYDITSNILLGLRPVLAAERPDWVLVHGDTTTTLATTLAAYYARIPVAHIEAGLRTGDKYAPFPEEMNRKITGAVADLHFAPTAASQANLLAEGVPAATIHVTGNTVIDALLAVVDKLRNDQALQAEFAQRFSFLDPARRLVLVTGHRRENFGAGFEQLCLALRDLAARGDVQVLYPVHLNPNVQEPVRRILGDAPNVVLVEPQDYLPFVYLMSRAHLILTDSGGIQEESTFRRVPCLTLRPNTERPITVTLGSNELVPLDMDAVRAAVEEIKAIKAEYRAKTRELKKGQAA